MDTDITLKEKILEQLEIKGRDIQWLKRNLKIDSESYLRNCLSELKQEGKIGRTMKTYWLMTQERADNYERVGRGEVVSGTKISVVNDLWCVATLDKRQTEERNELKRHFTKNDGEVFKLLAALILEEPLPKARVLPPEENWTEEMLDRWIQVQAALKRFKGNNYVWE